MELVHIFSILCHFNIHFLVYLSCSFSCVYFVLCSQEGVKLFKTSVTYSSLGESVEPYGHVDNFFISGYCRKLFDDSHPRESRKHYFYPRIGVRMVTMFYYVLLFVLFLLTVIFYLLGVFIVLQISL